MSSTQRWFLACVVVTSLGSNACIHDAAVGHGTWIGAVSGAALGVGAGVLVSDDHLLGSTKRSGLKVDSGQAIAAGAIIGAAFGAIIGSMAGHGRESKWPKLPEPETPAPTATSATGVSQAASVSLADAHPNRANAF